MAISAPLRPQRSSLGCSRSVQPAAAKAHASATLQLTGDPKADRGAAGAPGMTAEFLSTKTL
jgi:hypothetical protein